MEWSPVDLNIPPPIRLVLAAVRAFPASLNVRSFEAGDAAAAGGGDLSDRGVGSVGSIISMGMRRRLGCAKGAVGIDVGEGPGLAVVCILFLF